MIEMICSSKAIKFSIKKNKNRIKKTFGKEKHSIPLFCSGIWQESNVYLSMPGSYANTKTKTKLEKEWERETNWKNGEIIWRMENEIRNT